MLQAHSRTRQSVSQLDIYQASGAGHFVVHGQARNAARLGFLCQPVRLLQRQGRQPTHREGGQWKTKTK